MKPSAKIGAIILAVVAIACIAWLTIDPGRTMAWAALSEVIKAAAQMATGQ